MEREYPEIGKVVYQQNDRAKRLIIKIKSYDLVSVTIPKSTSFSKAENFLLSGKDWILQAKNKMQNVRPQVIYTEDVERITKLHSLVFKTFIDPKYTSMRANISDNIITVFLPQGVNKTETKVQDFVKQCIKAAYANEAKTYIPNRIKELAKRFNFSYLQVKVNSAQTRWGSCGSDNSINISCFIMKLPDYLIDFVLLHELCHTIHKNHGPLFYDLLRKVSEGNFDAFEKEMKTFRIR